MLPSGFLEMQDKNWVEEDVKKLVILVSNDIPDCFQSK